MVEASDAVGGRVRTDLVDGFVLDRGFQVILTAYPELARQLDVAALDLQAFEPGAVVWVDGRSSLVGDPLRRPGTVFSTLVSPVGSPLDKLRLLRLRQRLVRADPKSLLAGDDVPTAEALHSYGFSGRMVERFLRPLFAGIQLDPRLQTSRRMFDVIFRSLATGESAVPALGMGALPAQLAAGIDPAHVVLERTVTSVRPGQIEVDGQTIEAGVVVVATEGPAAVRLLGLPPVGSRAAGCVYFAADAPPSDSRHVHLGVDEHGPVNVAIMSNVAPAYAPPGQTLVAVAFPGDACDDLDARARQVVSSWWGRPATSWRHLRTDRIPHGQPDQRPPFAPKQRVALGDGLFVCGDHRDTGSIQGALFSGRRTGEAAIAVTS